MATGAGAWLAIVLSAASTLAGAPLAAAQGVIDPTLTVTVFDPGTDLVPETPAALTVRVRYGYGVGAASQDPVSVTLEVDAKPEWADVTIEPSVVTFEIPPQAAVLTGGEEKDVFANVTVLASAPARARDNFTVRATSKPAGNLAGAEATSPAIYLRTSYVALLNITGPSQDVHVRGGRDEVVPFVVTNLGNGVAPVTFKVVTKPENSATSAPGSFTLGRGESVTVDVTVRTPWVATERGLLEVEGVVTIDEDKELFSEPTRASVEIVGEAIVPAFPAWWSAFAALAVGLAGRRLRR